jgi:curli biogenesis system outer membrane secretion channel CsgG
MKTARIALWTILIAFLAVAAISPPAGAKKDEAPAGLKKMIAVVEFEDKSDRSRWNWTGPNPGRGMSDMLMTALVQSGEFSVMEREQLDHVLAEQNLGQSGMVTAQTAPQLGKLLGVTAIVYGSVSEFGYMASDTGGRISGLGGAGFSKTTARVSIDVRIIDTTTGEILLAETASDEKTQMGLKLSTEDFSFGHKGKFDQTLVGKATREAIEDLVESIVETLEDVPWTGRIIKASGMKIYLNAGQSTGITAGMKFNVYRMGEALIDPVTGLDLGAEEELLGVIEASDIKEKYAICSVVSGSGFDAGDMVRYE